MAHPTRITGSALIALITLIASRFMALQAEDKAMALKDASFEAGAEALLRKDSFLLQEGGAKLIEFNGSKWFVAVGMTFVGEQSSTERLRMLRVGRINALRAAAEFISPTEVETTTTLTETTTVTNTNGKKAVNARKILDDVTKTKVQTVLKAPPTLGTWQSFDGKLFYYAIGAKLQ
jgi:hypothetical protein